MYTRAEIHLIDEYYSYTHDLPFHTGKAAIDGQDSFNRWLVPGPIKHIVANPYLVRNILNQPQYMFLL